MLSCTGIVAGYGNRTVLHEIDFVAGAGEFVAILGPNGSGKTTLLRVLTGTVPLRSGDVFLCGSPALALTPKERAKRVAVVPQRVDALPHVRVREMVLLGRYPYLRWFGAYAPADIAVAESALAVVGATDLTDRMVNELSGGELQRVLLARALAQDAPALLLDELSAGLDMARMMALFDVLDAHRLRGTCLVTVMHDVNLAALYATRIVALRAGRVLFDGPTHEVFTEENLQALYDIPIHVFLHPTAPVPQACLSRL